MNSRTSATDAIVVGGGPVGFVTALALSKRGLSVRLFERDTEVYNLPRAITMDDEAQRIFEWLDLGDELRAITTPLPGAEFVTAEGERIIGAEFPKGHLSPLGHPLGTNYYQPELEAMIRRAASDRDIDVRLGTEVTSIGQDTNSVTARSRAVGSGGDDLVDEVHTARWLIAADGASSPIRKSLGIEFVDQGFDQEWLVMDLKLKRPVDTLPPLVQQICDPARPTTFVVGHADYRRWELQLQPGETRDEMLDSARIWQLLERWLTPEDAELIRAVVYRFHATVAASMRSGRVFLAGDSAHQMPPFLGQGLCSGLRDGINLAWKLQLVANGTGADGLLDTYDAERRPHAQEVVANAVDTGKLIDHLSGRTEPGADLESGYGGGRPFPRLENGMVTGDVPAGKQVPQPKIDDVWLDDLIGDGFALLVRDASALPAEAASRWSAMSAAVVEVPAGTLDELLRSDGVIIVRPDRYIAAVTTTAALAMTTTELLSGDRLVSTI